MRLRASTSFVDNFFFTLPASIRCRSTPVRSAVQGRRGEPSAGQPPHSGTRGSHSTRPDRSRGHRPPGRTPYGRSPTNPPSTPSRSGRRAPQPSNRLGGRRLSTSLSACGGGTCPRSRGRSRSPRGSPPKLSGSRALEGLACPACTDWCSSLNPLYTRPSPQFDPASVPGIDAGVGGGGGLREKLFSLWTYHLPLPLLHIKYFFVKPPPTPHHL